jgi:hypothetical protein
MKYVVHVNIKQILDDGLAGHEQTLTHELVCRLVNGKFLLRDTTTGKYAGVMAVGDTVDEALAKHIKYWITEENAPNSLG